VNVFRPFSHTVEEIEQLRKDIEHSSHIQVQGWINNSNLKEWTTLEYWQESQKLMKELVEQSRIPLVTSGIHSELASKLEMKDQQEWIMVRPYLDLGWKKRGV
jgi:hypothetical protein